MSQRNDFTPEDALREGRRGIREGFAQVSDHPYQPIPLGEDDKHFFAFIAALAIGDFAHLVVEAMRLFSEAGKWTGGVPRKVQGVDFHQGDWWVLLDDPRTVIIPPDRKARMAAYYIKLVVMANASDYEMWNRLGELFFGIQEISEYVEARVTALSPQS